MSMQAFLYIATTCSSLPLPDNGVIVYSSATPEPYQFGTTARYSCNIGFGLSGGDEMLSCGGDGSSPNGEWSGVIPTCDGEIRTASIIHYLHTNSHHMLFADYRQWSTILQS